MSMGKPVVASRIGGTSEFIQDGLSGFLVSHDQPGEFAEKVVGLLKDRKLAQSTGENARARVRSLYDEDPTERVVDLYRQCSGASA